MFRKLLLLPLIIISNLVNASEYTDAFPTYYEYCTATQLKYTPKYFDGSTGGIGGHGLIYVEGLCKDNSVEYPRVIPCEKSGEGVGISLDSDFKNVKWVAVPGRELFYNGTHDKKDISPLGINELESVKEVAYSLEVFKGVELKSLDSITAKAGSREYEMAAVEWAIGTDIALRYGRELRCVRTPIEKEQIKGLADFLNKENERYYFSDEDYEWDMFYNNCTHLSMNAGNSIILNHFIKTDRHPIVQIGNIAIPANDYMALSDYWVLKKPSLRRIRRSRAFQEYGMYPNQLGALMYKLPAFQTNEMFETDKLMGLSLPRKKIFKMFQTEDKYDKSLGDENSILKKSLSRWEKIYKKLLRKAGINKTKTSQYLQKQLEKIESLK